MDEVVRTPSHVKFRRETNYGLVYVHENYGYEDASLLRVNEAVVDALEYVDGGRDRADVEREFSPGVVDALAEEGLVTVEGEASKRESEEVVADGG